MFAIFLSSTPGVALPAATVSSCSSSALSGLIATEDMSADQLKIEEIRNKWNEVRKMTREEAESLEPEWKEAHTRYFDKFDSDIVNMEDIASKLKNMIELTQIDKKTKGQRKRDKWAKIQARDAFRAANPK
jgi:hypothetical protein